MKNYICIKLCTCFLFLVCLYYIPLVYSYDWDILTHEIWFEPNNGPPGTNVTIHGDMASKYSGQAPLQLWILLEKIPVLGTVYYTSDTKLAGWAEIPDGLNPGKIVISIITDTRTFDQFGYFEFTVTSNGIPKWMIQGGAVAIGAGVLAIGGKLLGGKKSPTNIKSSKQTTPRIKTPQKQVIPPKIETPKRMSPQKQEPPVHYCLNCGTRLIRGICPECGRPIGPIKSELDKIDEVADSVEHSIMGDGMEKIVAPLQQIKTVAIDGTGMVIGKIASDITEEQMRLGGLGKAVKDVVFKRKILKFKKVAKYWNKVKRVMKTLKKPMQVLDVTNKIYSGVKGYNKYLQENQDFIKDNKYLGRILGAAKGAGDVIINTLLTKNPVVGIADTAIDLITGGRVQPVGQAVKYAESLVDKGSYAAMYNYHSREAMKNVTLIPSQKINQMIEKLNDTEYVTARGLSPEKVNTLKQKYTNMLSET